MQVQHPVIDGVEYPKLIDWYFVRSKALQNGAHISSEKMTPFYHAPSLNLAHHFLNLPNAMFCDVVHWMLCDYCTKRLQRDRGQIETEVR